MATPRPSPPRKAVDVVAAVALKADTQRSGARANADDGTTLLIFLLFVHLDSLFKNYFITVHYFFDSTRTSSSTRHSSTSSLYNYKLAFAATSITTSAATTFTSLSKRALLAALALAQRRRPPYGLTLRAFAYFHLRLQLVLETRPS